MVELLAGQTRNNWQFATKEHFKKLYYLWQMYHKKNSHCQSICASL